MIESGLVSLLTANTALMALIDPNIYPVEVPESATQTALSYRIVAIVPAYTLEGKETQRARVEFDIWDKASYGNCKIVLKALRNALDTFRGTLTDGSRVLSTLRINQTDFYENDSRSFRTMQEYSILFVEAN